MYCSSKTVLYNNLCFLSTVRGNFIVRSFHVQFFGDNGRRSWLYSNCVIRFEGLEALNKLAAKMQSEVRKYH